MNEHQWYPPGSVIHWEYCKVCLFIKRADGKNGPCKGPQKLRRPELPQPGEQP